MRASAQSAHSPEQHALLLTPRNIMQPPSLLLLALGRDCDRQMTAKPQGHGREPPASIEAALGLEKREPRKNFPLPMSLPAVEALEKIKSWRKAATASEKAANELCERLYSANPSAPLDSIFLRAEDGRWLPSKHFWS